MLRPDRFVHMARIGSIFLLNLSWLLVLLAASPPVQAQKPVRDDGLAPARALSPAEQARRAGKQPQTLQERWYEDMSPMGALAARIAAPSNDPDYRAVPAAPRRLAPAVIGSSDVIIHGPNDVATQSETSIAGNTDGSVLIAGYNDARGFSSTPVSLSGVARSTDGGQTWAEVPVGPGGAGTLPVAGTNQVFGDPEVKYDPINDRFVYASIYVRSSDNLQGMSVHVSNADGSVWNGPFQVTPSFVTSQSADKEFMDINPATGRILMSWTQFSTGPARILAAYSDDGGATWSAASPISTAPSTNAGVQSSIPRFMPGTGNADSKAYISWRVSNADGTRTTGFARSLDGGATWQPAVTITPNFTAEDQILGVDRVNTSPSMAVDYTSGRIYIVYQANNSRGEGDIAFQTSGDSGATFSQRILINSNPGLDRAQFYPWVTVDQTTHRVHAIWYDQDPESSGDLTEVMHTYSIDGGTTWSRPTPLLDRPFRAGFGNDTGQPNVGDYMQATAINGVLHTVTAATPPEVAYNEGQPSSASLFPPDSYYDRLSDLTNVAALRLGQVTATELFCADGANGAIDPGELAGLTFALENYVANPATSPTTFASVQATLSSSTPGVTIYSSSAQYANIAPLGVQSNAQPFQVYVGPSVTPGTVVELLLSVITDQGAIQLPYRLRVGSGSAGSVLINEDFEAVTTPALPGGWSSNVGGGTNVPWVTDSAFTGSKAAFHTNGTGFKFIRLFSPVVAIPAATAGTAPYVTLDFDISYRTEDEPAQDVWAYDGLTVRLTDQTSGALLRSVLAEAFAEELKTGALNHFPKHLPRSTNVNYFQDMSVWAGNSNGVTHVRMKFPGAGMTGRSVQLRFEYTEDSVATCTDVGMAAPCGVAVDNIVLRTVVPASNACSIAGAPTDLAIAKSATPGTIMPGSTLTYTLAYTNAGQFAASNVVITDSVPLALTNLQYASSGPPLTPIAGPAYRWSVGALAPGASGRITITGVLSGNNNLQPLVNTASIGGSNQDLNPANNSSSATVQVQNAPITGLSASNSSPTPLGQTTALTATATGGSGTITYAWNFGDGTLGSGATASHVYGAVGTYTAIVTATNSVGSATASTVVTIINRPITGLSASNSSPTPLGQTTALTATVGGGSGTITYAWNFGDGTLGSGETTSHVYGAVGTYTAIVTATNSVGSATASTVVTIIPATRRIYMPVLIKSPPVLALWRPQAIHPGRRIASR